MRGHRVQNKYTINFGKKIQETMRNAKASPKGRAFFSLSPKPARTALRIASCFPSAMVKFYPLRSSRPEGVFSFSAQKYAESLR